MYTLFGRLHLCAFGVFLQNEDIIWLENKIDDRVFSLFLYSLSLSLVQFHMKTAMNGSKL